VPVRIAIAETSFKKLARAYGGRWDPEEKLWFIQYGKIKGTPLEKHIILDAFAASKPEKHIILDAFEASNIGCMHIILDACI
jgi:hypothetical protein